MKKYLLILSSALYSFSSFAEGDKEQQLAKIQAGLQQKSELRMNFKQTVYTQLRKKKEAAKDMLILKSRPNFAGLLKPHCQTTLFLTERILPKLIPLQKQEPFIKTQVAN